MGHIEEKTESYVTGPAGNRGARQDTRGVSHQLPTCRSSIFGSPAKLATILQESSGSWGCSELQPNVLQVLKIRTDGDGLGLMQHGVSGQNSTSISDRWGQKKKLGTRC